MADGNEPDDMVELVPLTIVTTTRCKDDDRSAPLASPEVSMETLAMTSTSGYSGRCFQSSTSIDMHSDEDTKQLDILPSNQSIMSVESVLFCRICHQGCSEEPLVTPCQCTGTIGLLHASCLETWLASSGTDKCEICGLEYNMKMVSKSFLQWLRGHTSRKERNNIFTDGACFFILTPLACMSTWLCVSGAKYFNINSLHVHKLETWGLAILTIILVVIYFVWCIVVIRYHRKTFENWRRKNSQVRLLTESENHKDVVLKIDHNQNLL